jgi:hypothetical protein
MKKILLFILLVSISHQMWGQDAVATQDEIQKFMKTTTYVVYDENIFGSYNSAIKKAVENYWTLTPIKFIKATEYRKLRKSYRNSFIIRTKVNFEKDKSNTSYTFLSVLLGSNKGSMESMPDLISFPLSYYNVDYDKYHYKMGAIVKFMQNHIILTRDNPGIMGKKNVLMYYNKNTSDLKDKTLYCIKDELDKDVNTNSKIKQYYSGKVVITTAEEIEKIIAKKDPNAVFLHKVGPSAKDDKLRIYKLIMGAADGKLYYFGYHKFKKGKKNDAFLAADFKKLGS